MGSEVGPFNLYSDVDNYVTPFDTDVPASAFTYGYYTTSVPDGTLNIKVKSEGECVNFIITIVQNLPTPSVTPGNTPTNTTTPTVTPSVTPTCGTLTTQYLKSELQGNSQIRFRLYNDAGFTSNANAVCDYTFGGTFDIDGGAINQPYSTIMVTNDHDHSYNAGSQITAYTVTSITYACNCVNVISNVITPTPSPTQTMTQTPSTTQQATPTLTASPTRTPQVTPTPSPTSGLTDVTMYVYGKYINTPSIGDLQYQVNGGLFVNIGPVSSTSCDFITQILGLQVGDTVDFTDNFTRAIAGSTSTCPSGPGGFGCNYSYSVLVTGSQFVYITIDGSVAC